MSSKGGHQKVDQCKQPDPCEPVQVCQDPEPVICQDPCKVVDPCQQQGKGDQGHGGHGGGGQGGHGGGGHGGHGGGVKK